MKINVISYLTLKYNGTSFGSKQPKDEKRFIKIRDKLEADIERFETRKNLADWEFSINSNETNKKILQRECRRISNYYNNSSGIFSELSKLEKRDNIVNPKLIRQLTYLLGLFDMSDKNDKEAAALRRMEMDISQKRNSFQIKIDGKPFSETEIIHREFFETNPDIRKKLYSAETKAGDIIAEDIIKLIKKRNDYARKKGFKNYFEYKYLECSDYSMETLEKWMDEIYKSIIGQSIIIKGTEKQKQAELFGISPNEIREYHRKFILPNSPEQKVNKKIVSVSQMIDICKKAYKGMGFDIDKMPLVLDLLPRKNKDTSDFCLNITPGSDERINANLTNDFRDLITLFHELGHAIYDLNTDKSLNYMDKSPSSVLSEGFAMMMEDVMYGENLTKDISDTDLSKSLKDYRIIEIMKSLMRINFERSMYQNPNQDPKKLWNELNVKYNYGSPKEDLSNYWATINHFVENPAYHAIYFISELFKVQLYNTLTQKFGKITQNEDVRNYLKRHMFKYGSSLPDDEIVKKATGKSLSPEDFIKSVQ